MYTNFCAEHFAAGASSLRTLRKMLRMECLVYHLPNLHAKVVLVDDAFATVGSQNLTNQGRRNREATLLLNEVVDVARVRRLTEGWTKERIALSVEMIDDMEKAIVPLKQRMRALLEDVAKIDADVMSKEEHRVEQKRRRKEREVEERLDRERQHALRIARIKQALSHREARSVEQG
ncbi:MAG: phospholipase D-like domain-containing protein [Methanocella sp.]